MFTFDDIRAIAVQIEHNGETAYRKAADRVDDPRLAELFRWMAEEEQRHGRYFAGIKGVELPVAGAEAAQRMGRDLLQEMVKEQTFSLDLDDLAAAVDVAAVLRQSLTFEEDTILFYQFLGDLIEDAAVKEQLTAIIAEERRHVTLLDGMLDDGGA
ncbi:ferritin family protein [Desulfoprunum benzoelyticum]|uniref:Rubrerythrin n=1 Tax=Desulfoprunum benzoelyticum TaxID=1506996 RepID=A0A840V1R1_9BACT|nr:ferritin family protein [Desulfoprunum benzoelyticum]MBB5348788.1 rubrerythrin [Desulfoprunum benzoelyticum]MBM9529951.1 ferritin family protein [Desulfoprunum benzoelyticum]